MENFFSRILNKSKLSQDSEQTTEKTVIEQEPEEIRIDESAFEDIRYDLEVSIKVSPGQTADELLHGFVDQTTARAVLEKLENELFLDSEGRHFVNEDAMNHFDAGDEYDIATDNWIPKVLVQGESEPLIDRTLRVIKNAPDGLTFNDLLRGVGIEKDQPDFETRMWELDAVLEDQLASSGKVYYSRKDGVYCAMDTEKFESELLSEIYEQGIVNAKSLARTSHSGEDIINAACERLTDAGKLMPCDGDKYRLTEMREDDAKVLAYIKENGTVDLEKLCRNFEHDIEFPEINVERLEYMGEIVIGQDGLVSSKSHGENITRPEQERISKTSQSAQNIKDSATVGKPNMADVIKLESQAVQVETVTDLQEQEQSVPALDNADLKAAATDMRIAAQDARTASNLRNVATASRTILTEKKETEKKTEQVTSLEEDSGALQKSVETNTEKTRTVSTTKFNENDIVAYRFNDATLGVRIGRFKGAVVKTSANGQERTGINLATDGRTVFYDDAHGIAEPATEQEKDKFKVLGETRDRNRSRDRERERGRGSQGRY